MTAKDYDLLARTVAAMDRAYRGRVGYALMQALRNTNPRFDGERFFRACEGKS